MYTFMYGCPYIVVGLGQATAIMELITLGCNSCGLCIRSVISDGELVLLHLHV